MNATSRAILQSVVATDAALSATERDALQRALDGTLEKASAIQRCGEEPLLLTQKMVARLLSVSRVTVWRVTRDGLLHPVEVIPGTVRYAWEEVTRLARPVSALGNSAQIATAA